MRRCGGKLRPRNAPHSHALTRRIPEIPHTCAGLQGFECECVQRPHRCCDALALSGCHPDVAEESSVAGSSGFSEILEKRSRICYYTQQRPPLSFFVVRLTEGGGSSSFFSKKHTVPLLYERVRISDNNFRTSDSAQGKPDQCFLFATQRGSAIISINFSQTHGEFSTICQLHGIHI